MTAPTRRDDAVSTPNEATSTRPERSSARVARKAPLGWLPWLLLGLLALLLALVLLVINAIDDDGPDGAAGDSLGQVGASDGSGANGADEAGSSEGATTDGGTSDGTATDGGAAQAALTAGGQDLLAVRGGAVGSLAGQSATGRGVVESVVADEGFWVGSSATSRVFVHLSPEARRSAGESGFQVQQGQTVQLEGTVERSDASFAERVGVDAAEGRQQLIDQGGYVEATRVALAG